MDKKLYEYQTLSLTKYPLVDYEYNPQPTLTALPMCLLPALNVLAMSEQFKTQLSFARVLNQTAHKSRMQQLYRFLNRGGNRVPVGVPIFKGSVDGLKQYFGLKYSGIIERKQINTLFNNVNLLVEHLDTFESTNILAIADHVFQDEG